MSSKDFKVQVLPDSKSLGEKAAQLVARKIQSVVKEKGKIRVIFATGASQLNFIESLIRTKGVPWNKVECFHLDEYVGLDLNHEASFRLYLKERLWVRHQTMKEDSELKILKLVPIQYLLLIWVIPHLKKKL